MVSAFNQLETNPGGRCLYTSGNTFARRRVLETVKNSLFNPTDFQSRCFNYCRQCFKSKQNNSLTTNTWIYYEVNPSAKSVLSGVLSPEAKKNKKTIDFQSVHFASSSNTFMRWKTSGLNSISHMINLRRPILAQDLNTILLDCRRCNHILDSFGVHVPTKRLYAR